MDATLIRWRKAQPIWTRIVLGRSWAYVASVLTPAHLLRMRALHLEMIAAIFNEHADPNDPPRWFEVLTLGCLRRAWAGPTDAAPSKQEAA